MAAALHSTASARIFSAVASAGGDAKENKSMAVCAGGGGGGSVMAAAEMVLGDWATVDALHGGARRIKTRSAAHATRKASNSVRSLGRAHVMAAMLCCAPPRRVGRMAGPGMAPVNGTIREWSLGAFRWFVCKSRSTTTALI